MERNLVLLDKENLHNAYLLYFDSLGQTVIGIERQLKSLLRLSSKPLYKSRVKSFNSYFKKLTRIKPPSLGQQDLPVLTDLIGIRVICAFLEDLTTVEKIITSNFEIVEVEKKGAERSFSQFGYESTHILIKIPEEIAKERQLPPGLVCEIQVRTILQDAWAEVEHELIYKSEFTPFDLPLRRKLAAVNASLNLADIVFQEIRDYQSKLNRELDCRRASFYEQADSLSKGIGYLSETGLEEEVPETIESISPFVHGTIDDMILEAIHAHNSGELDKAKEIYSQIIDSKPQPNDIVLSVILKHRGMAFFAQNQYKEALADFMASAEHDPKNFRSLYYVGIVYSILEDNETAVEYFDKSLDVNEFQSHVYYRRGLANYHLNKFDDAIDDVKKAIGLGLEDDDVKKLYETLSAQKEMKF